MINMTNDCKMAMCASALLWFGIAGSAQAGVIIIDDPFSPPDQIVVATFPGCPANTARLELKLMPLLRRLQSASYTPAPAMAAPQVALATPVPVTRSLHASGHGLVVGVAF
jgi:hypothetical protein